MKDGDRAIAIIIVFLILFGLVLSSGILLGTHILCTGCVDLQVNTSYGSAGIIATGLTPRAEIFIITEWSFLGSIIIALLIFRKPISNKIMKTNKTKNK